MDPLVPEGSTVQDAERVLPAALRVLPDTSVGVSEGQEYYSLKDVIERHREVTDKISTQVRTISIGMLVFVWSMLNAAPGTKIAEAEQTLGSGGVGIVAMFAVLALLTDYAQYVLGKQVVDMTRTDQEHLKSGRYKWPTQSIAYQAQFWFFWAKQGFCMFGVLAMVFVVFFGFF